MKNNRIISALLAGICMTSCVDLTEHMYNDLDKINYYSTEQEYRAAFMNQYANLRVMFVWNNWYLQEITTDEACLPQKGRDGYDGGMYQRLHWHIWTPEDEIIHNAWKELYQAVGFCNQIIADVRAATILSEETKTRMVSETRSLRAYFYFRLLDMFGGVPVVETVSEVNPATKSRAEVFAFVEKELLDTQDDLLRLKDSGSYGRFTYEAGLALLSRLYLNAGVYTGTARWDDCIRVSRTLLEQGISLDEKWDDPFVWDNQNSRENIFVIPNDEIYANEMSPLFFRNIHWAQGPQWQWKGPNGGWNAIVSVREFIETFDIENDLRCHYDPQNGKYGQFIWGLQTDSAGNPIYGTNECAGQQLDLTLDVKDMVDNKENAGARNVKWKPKAGAYGLSNDVAVIRLPEVMFNLAEACIRSGVAVDSRALDGINHVRRRAGVAEYDEDTLTLEEIYAERGREFCYEAQRRTDMVRYGTFVQPMWDKDYVDEESRNIYPIPYLELNINPNLKPNVAN